ncbi:SGNH/GDSL hydrolase family protein [Candidatus Saccharibacteria bacterium]|nr:SGNH/GDSL hydrolase family protein [Candidatus Saccharibacteria bacterium]
MLRRFITAAIVALLLAVGIPAVSASSQSSANGSWMNTLNSSGDGPNIAAGLCLGASLDFSAASAARCVRQTRPSTNTASRTATTADREVPRFQYAALGDSVASGNGLPEGNNLGDGVCDRSTESYPYYIAAALDVSFIHVACRGATMQNMLVSQSVIGPNPAPQLNSAFAAGTPELITITAGANDARWQTVLLRCLRGACGTNSDARTLQTAFASLQNESQAALNEIAERSSGRAPQVILTGYYNPIASCAGVHPRVTDDELAWISDQLDNLNATLAAVAAEYSFATFVPINFTGHDLCSADPWVQDTDDPAPLHPTATGQQAIAQTILANL